MLTKEQLRILGVFRKDLFASLTFKQIKQESRQKSHNTLQKALKEFLRQHLVLPSKTGDVTTYQLNLDNNLVLAYLNVLNEQELAAAHLPKSVLEELQSSISKHTALFILLVFGGYAKDKATEKSDLDIAIIVDTEAMKKDLIPALETVKRRELLVIDYHVFTQNEFIAMLHSELETVGKQILKYNKTYHGYIAYCEMLWHERRHQTLP